MFRHKRYPFLNAIIRFRDEIRARKQHVVKKEKKCALRAEVAHCERHTASDSHSKKKKKECRSRSPEAIPVVE